MLSSIIEIWKDVQDNSNYEVSNLGQVRNKKTSQILKPFRNNSGYQVVKLITKHNLIHRLVASAFIDNPLNKKYVDHIDSNKDNNRVDNLQWVTCSENIQKAYNDGLHNLEKHKTYVGRKNARSKTKYFNVSTTYYDYKGKRTYYYLAKVTHNGKNLCPRKFKTEEEAALHVNWIIDTYKLDRPKNIIDKSSTTISKESTPK